MDYTEDENIGIFDDVEDKEFAYRKATHIDAEVVFVNSTEVRVRGQEQKSSDERVDEPVSDCSA